MLMGAFPFATAKVHLSSLEQYGNAGILDTSAPDEDGSRNGQGYSRRPPGRTLLFHKIVLLEEPIIVVIT